MKKRLDITIGIPAYNEEANIRKLLLSLLSQEQRSYKIREIIVVSDGSTDKTKAFVRSIKNPTIRFIKGKKRLGQQVRQNQIIKKFKGDILVIMEADTLPHNVKTIEELVKPFQTKRKTNLGMVVGNGMALSPKTFFEKILFYGSEIKKNIFREWKNGNNIYTCGGHSAKALSKEFINKLRYPANVPEDAYTYLCLKQQGLEMERQGKAKILMKNVTNLDDRIKQVSKFLSGRKILRKHFPKSFIEKEYALPKFLILKHILLESLRKPFWTFLYILEVTTNRILTLNCKKFNALYKNYPSSKNLKNLNTISAKKIRFS